MCVLRAIGKKFTVEDFLRESYLLPCLVYHKGERRLKDSLWKVNGFNVSVGDAELGDLEGQVQDAIAFLQDHRSELEKLQKYVGVERVFLDFALVQENSSVFSTSLPAELLRLAGDIGIDIELTYFPPSDYE
jgi:hypothetical protein